MVAYEPGISFPEPESEPLIIVTVSHPRQGCGAGVGAAARTRIGAARTSHSEPESQPQQILSRTPQSESETEFHKILDLVTAVRYKIELSSNWNKKFSTWNIHGDPFRHSPERLAPRSFFLLHGLERPRGRIAPRGRGNTFHLQICRKSLPTSI